MPNWPVIIFFCNSNCDIFDNFVSLSLSLSCPNMSVPSNVFDIRFVPSRYDSTLNSHSSTSDSYCNVDHNLSYDCSYFDNSSFNSTTFNQTDLSLLHTNSRSLNRNSNTITDYLSTLNRRFDIYGITESWSKESSDSNLIALHGYIAENCVRRDRKGGGATLFVNPGLHYTVRNDLQLNCADCDSLFIEMTNPNKDHCRNNLQARIRRL